jgi:RNA-directed DNA polymerase
MFLLRDRIVHHLLVSKLEPHFEKRFISTSFACRKDKGLLKAVEYITKSVRKITENNTKMACYGQFDIRSFFTSINKTILEEIIVKEIQDHFPKSQKEDLVWLTKVIINHNPVNNYYLKGDHKLIDLIPTHKTLFKSENNRGLPIGNLTSQFFANVYLNELDQFVKRILKVKHYVRYVDDFVVLSTDLSQIREWRKEIDLFLKETLHLSLHPNKDKYNTINSGINFVGYIIKPKYRLARKRVVQNLKSKLHFFNNGRLLVSQNQKQLLLPLSVPPSEDEIDRILAVVNSYYGHFKHANCYNLRRSIYEKHFGNLKEYLLPIDDNFSYFKIKKQKNE